MADTAQTRAQRAIKNLHGVAPGQLWRSNDARERDRELLFVERVEPPYAYARKVGHARLARIRLDRFTAGGRGYTCQAEPNS